MRHVCCRATGDGSINFDEFRQMLQKYKPSRRGGSVKESLSSPASTSSCASEYDLRETFDIFDKDADGYLNAIDLRSVFDGFIDLFYRQLKSCFSQLDLQCTFAYQSYSGIYAEVLVF